MEVVAEYEKRYREALALAKTLKSAEARRVQRQVAETWKRMADKRRLLLATASGERH